MMKRYCFLIVSVCIVFVQAGIPVEAASIRETPLVMAVRQAKLAVVNIHSEKTAPHEESLFSTGRNRKVNGMGTGIIVDERGYIVTNHHVVDGVDSLRVTTFDGSNYNASVVATDQPHDLAIIRIHPTKPLTVMASGTSSDLMLGETVIAVGNAFGYEHTVTSGIVSSLSRDVEVNEKQSYHNLIQTDASINPGNSGGPLLNLEGEIVGINVAIRAGAQRIGFAIPIDAARRIIAEMLNAERLENLTHGVVCTDVKAGKQRMLVVKDARASSPAAKSGLQPGDVILKAGDIDIVDGADLERAVLGHEVGDSLSLVVRRQDDTVDLTLELAAARDANNVEPTYTVVRANNDDSATSRAWEELGMRLRSITDDQKKRVMPRYRGGMLVESIRPDSPAARHGIREGDILVGLHVWETVDAANVSYVLSHPQRQTFQPLKFYILRGAETLYGHLQLQVASRK